MRKVQEPGLEGDKGDRDRQRRAEGDRGGPGIVSPGEAGLVDPGLTPQPPVIPGHL